MRVLKFGGTSVGTVERLGSVIDIIKNASKRDQIIVVLSALGGVTDCLIAATGKAKAGDDSWQNMLEGIQERHYEALTKLSSEENAEDGLDIIDQHIERLQQCLSGIMLLKECIRMTYDTIISAGERLSVRVIEAALKTNGLNPVVYKPEALIRTDSYYGDAVVDFSISNQLIRCKLGDLQNDCIPVIGGFIGSDEDGHTTTLGRSGSDYTATIIGGALSAKCVEIWTDVDGILSADPKIISQATTLPSISYQQASEMAFYGANVIHPKTLLPVQGKAIPVEVKNSFFPENNCTVITAPEHLSSETALVVSSKNDLSMIDICSHQFLQPNIFAILAKQHVDIYLTNQSNSIMIVLQGKDKDIFLSYVEKEEDQDVQVTDDVSLISVFHDNSISKGELLERTFSALKKRNLTHKILSYSISGKNIFLLTKTMFSERFVSILHSALYEERTKIKQSVAA